MVTLPCLLLIPNLFLPILLTCLSLNTYVILCVSRFYRVRPSWWKSRALHLKYGVYCIYCRSHLHPVQVLLFFRYVEWQNSFLHYCNLLLHVSWWWASFLDWLFSSHHFSHLNHFLSLLIETFITFIVTWLAFLPWLVKLIAGKLCSIVCRKYIAWNRKELQNI